jgi:hypothetical protein
MSIIDVSNKVDNIVDDLFTSFDKDNVEDVFRKNEIDDMEDRIQLLRKCMRVIETSNAEDELSIDDEYNDELEIFIEGSWRFLI